MDDVLARLLEKVENRYYGKCRAFVVDNADPENRGRLRLRIPSVLGKDVVSGWALPCAPYGGAADQGFFFIPEKDAGVWVEFEAGNLDYPIWVGAFWGKPGGNTEVPEEAQSDVTLQRVIKTSSGTLILLDDSEESLTIKDKTGNTIKISPSEFSITAKKKLTIDAGTEDIEIKGKNITIEASGNNNIRGQMINLN